MESDGSLGGKTIRGRTGKISRRSGYWGWDFERREERESRRYDCRGIYRWMKRIGYLNVLVQELGGICRKRLN
jgi:hypothetical protein